jgi:hypothetical protein
MDPRKEEEKWRTTPVRAPIIAATPKKTYID